MPFHPEVVLLTKHPHDIYVDTNVSLGKTCIADSHIVGSDDSFFQAQVKRYVWVAFFKTDVS